MAGPHGAESDQTAGWHRPRAELFKALVALWVFPSLGALLILGMTAHVWSEANSLRAFLGATRFEQWIAFGLLFAHGVFLFLARHYRLTEKPVPIRADDDAGPGPQAGDG